MDDAKNTTSALIPFQYAYETEYVSHPDHCSACNTEHGILVMPPAFRRLCPGVFDEPLEDLGSLSCVGRKIVFVGNLPIYETITGYINAYALPQATGEYASFFLQLLRDPTIQGLQPALATYYHSDKTVLRDTLRLGHYQYDIKDGLVLLESLPKYCHILWIHPYLALEYASILRYFTKKSADVELIQKIIEADIVQEHNHFTVDVRLRQAYILSIWQYAPYFRSSSVIATSPSYVYLIRRGDARVFKIGISTHPERRLHDLQGANAESLSLIQAWQVPQAIHIERVLHRMFDAVRMQGEWFALSVEQEAELIIYMKQYQDEAYA